MFREVLVGVVILAGAALTVTGLVAAGWWALAVLGGSGMVVFGLMSVSRPEPDDDESSNADGWLSDG